MAQLLDILDRQGQRQAIHDERLYADRFRLVVRVAFGPSFYFIFMELADAVLLAHLKPGIFSPRCVQQSSADGKIELILSRFRRLRARSGKSCFYGLLTDNPRPANAVSQRQPFLSSPPIKGLVG